MIIRLRIVQTDLLQNVTQVLADGRAILRNDCILFQEAEPFQGKGRIVFSETGLTLIHEGETKSRTELCTERTGTAEALSAFGEMRFETELLEYRRTPGSFCAEYQLRQRETVIGHFRLRCRYETETGVKPS